MSRKPGLATLALVALLLLTAALRLGQLASLPPGLWYDEAVNGVDVRMILSGQGLPIYFPANQGREPLFIYLQAVSVALLGPSPFSLRLVSALAGIAAVAATYACGIALFRPRAASFSSWIGERIDPRWPALLAATALAVSFWHVSLSRLGLRAALLPLFTALTLLTFWRAWTGRRLAAYGWAGFWFGLSLYTYTSARLLPLAPALFILTEWADGRLREREPSPASAAAAHTRGRGLALALLVGLLIAAPLGVELVRHPALVLGRAGDVLVSENSASNQAPLLAAGANAITVLRAFYDRGDPNLAHNLPGRPATDPLTAVLFTVGALTALWRFRNPQPRLLLIWFGVMLLPSVLSGQAPHYLRAAGALPPYALLVGLGGASLARLAPAGVRRVAWAALIALVCLFSGGPTARDYFQRWAARPELAYAFTVEAQSAAERAGAALDEPSGAIRLPSALYATPNMIYRLGAITERLAGGDNAAPVERSRVGPLWQITRAAAVEAAALHPDGTAWQPEAPLNYEFANGLRLVGYDIEPSSLPALGSSASITLTLYWQPAPGIDGVAAAASDVFAHLVADGAVRATANGALLANYRLVWPALHGLLVDPRVFQLPADMPPGKAHFEVGLYTRRPWEPYSRAQRIPFLDGTGQPAGDQVVLAPIMVAAPPSQADLAGVAPLSALFEGRIELAGWQLEQTGAEPNAVTARFCWTAVQRAQTDLTAFVHLIDASGEIVSQFDTQPGGATNATSLWVPGETACSEHPLTLPAGRSLTDFHLRVGLYEPVSGRQWRVAAPGLDEAATYLILRPENVP